MEPTTEGCGSFAARGLVGEAWLLATGGVVFVGL